MPETPLEPAPVIDVLLRQGAFLGGRGRRSLLVPFAVILGAVFAIVYFTAFPGPRRALPASPGSPLDRSAVAVAAAFTRLGWNEHNCRAASRYSSGPNNCPSRVLPAGNYTFPLNTWLIQRHCGNARARPASFSVAGRHISPGCVQYSATNNETISYTMAKLPKGWRVIAVEASRG
jgi:hypothetical protein